MTTTDNENRLIELIESGQSLTGWLEEQLYRKADSETIDEEFFGQVALAAAALSLIAKGLDEELVFDLIYSDNDWDVTCSIEDGDFVLDLKKVGETEDFDDLSDEPLPWEA